MECVNCGKYGHSFRDCKEPTASYGIIAIRYMHSQGGESEEDEERPHYLLVRRRDSLSYVDFLRGKYSMSDRAYIQTLINHMTTEEHTRLLGLPFDTLWMNLWNSQNTRQFRSEFEHAKRAFDTIRTTGDISGRLLRRYIADRTGTWTEPEWGFPKGRRSPHESEFQCAVREFCEETGLSPSDIRVRSGQTPEYEEYTGTNAICYKHTYYLADCDKNVQLNKTNRVQTREIGDIGWFPFEEAYMKIRATNPEKRAVLGCVHAREQKAE